MDSSFGADKDKNCCGLAYLSPSSFLACGICRDRHVHPVAGQEDWTYGGFGNNWLGMWHVLHKKFEPDSDLESLPCLRNFCGNTLQ